jgi:hypothetical protein
MNESSISTASRFDRFLYASVCEERNGMQLSVLSTLARMNLDPWEEAARLATMPKAIAEETLASTLDNVGALSRNSMEAKAAAARLVQLLPRRREEERSTLTDAARGDVNYPVLWLVWMSLAIAISLSSPRHQETAADPGSQASRSNAVAPLRSDSAPSNSAAPSR